MPTTRSCAELLIAAIGDVFTEPSDLDTATAANAALPGIRQAYPVLAEALERGASPRIRSISRSPHHRESAGARDQNRQSAARQPRPPCETEDSVAQERHAYGKSFFHKGLTLTVNEPHSHLEATPKCGHLDRNRPANCEMIEQSRAQSSRVVILGGGFGGVAVAQELERLARRLDRPIDVTLISQTNSLLGRLGRNDFDLLAGSWKNLSESVAQVARARTAPRSE